MDFKTLSLSFSLFLPLPIKNEVNLLLENEVHLLLENELHLLLENELLDELLLLGLHLGQGGVLSGEPENVFQKLHKAVFYSQKVKKRNSR